MAWRPRDCSIKPCYPGTRGDLLPPASGGKAYNYGGGPGPKYGPAGPRRRWCDGDSPFREALLRCLRNGWRGRTSFVPTGPLPWGSAPLPSTTGSPELWSPALESCADGAGFVATLAPAFRDSPEEYPHHRRRVVPGARVVFSRSRSDGGGVQARFSPADTAAAYTRTYRWMDATAGAVADDVLEHWSAHAAAADRQHCA